MIVAAGNSSNTITTTGPGTAGTSTEPRSSLDPPATSSDVGLKNRNEPTNNRFAAAR